MIQIKEVKTKKDLKTFVDFPTKLYKGVTQYSYPFRSDEFTMFSPKKNPCYKDCEVVMYLAYKQGKVVGRVAGIIHKLYNKKVNEKRVRFTRFDCVNDVEVAKALLGAVEQWAVSKGMQIAHGPLGFSDLDSEGLIVEGFDERCTFEARYNFEYYKDLIEACGYTKDVDWIERKIYPPKQIDKRVDKLADYVAKRYNLKFAEQTIKKEYISKYKDGIFDVLDKAYGTLYGVVPYTEELKAQLLDQFLKFISLKYMFVITNEKDEVVCFGIGLPALNNAVYKSKGRMTLPALFRLLKALKKPRVVDFAIVGVRPDYENAGVGAMLVKYLNKRLIEEKVDYCETNLCLENNVKISRIWEYFDHKVHRRRRSYTKNLI